MRLDTDGDFADDDNARWGRYGTNDECRGDYRDLRSGHDDLGSYGGGFGGTEDRGEDDYGDFPTVRHPISVADLLAREGYKPSVRERMARRTLTGVAAGAVLALGAVAGSLLLNHGTPNTTGGTLAAGTSNGTFQQYGDAAASTATSPSQQQSTTTDAPPVAPMVHTVSGSPVAGSAGKAKTVDVPARTTTSRAATAPVSSAPSTAPTSSVPAASAPAPSSSAPASSAPVSSQPTAPAQPPSSTSTPPPSSGGNGGLLGTVTGTVTGVVGSVTQPVFSWFG